MYFKLIGFFVSISKMLLTMKLKSNTIKFCLFDLEISRFTVVMRTISGKLVAIS